MTEIGKYTHIYMYKKKRYIILNKSNLACHWGGLVTIPIAAQATSSHLLYVIRNTLLTTMVIDQTHLDFTLQVIEGTSVKYIIVVDSQEESERNYFGVFVYSLQALKKLGQEKLIDRSNLLSKKKVFFFYFLLALTSY